ncbi:reverse transcriptase domain-containing protein [Cellvibrio sp. NN19]|uniref:reverse transcriptase domain-containing protein n=1 Tax=Cellvibrio chitinivorans TaxID=3102792 RepID=UPI002B40225E|nr:reverse transcriptase domain-containing protein [Cellvibrio sp. NN19]
MYIPKANDKLSPLGVSMLRDRVCMTAALLMLEPIFEADLPPQMYVYRPRRNVQQAIVEVQEQMYRGRPDVIDADLSDYFGSIPHVEMLKSLVRRVVDRRVLSLLKPWLEFPVEERDSKGRATKTTEAKDQRRGIPQGSPVSPLLANLYMRRFVVAWKLFGLNERLGSFIVTYADDLVILCRCGKAGEASSLMRKIMEKLKLTVNEEKTRICRIPEESFDFLGYTFGRLYLQKTGKARLGMRPSRKSIKNMVQKLHGMTTKSYSCMDTTEMVKQLNRTLVGWANYFSVETHLQAYRAIESYIAMQLRKWLRHKYKVRGRRGGAFPQSLLICV